MLILRHIDRPAGMLTSINAAELAFVYRDVVDVARSRLEFTISTTCPVLMSASLVAFSLYLTAIATIYAFRVLEKPACEDLI